MKVSLVTSALVVGAMVCASVSLAVAPQPGKVYIGDIKSSPFTMHVSVTVAKNGKSATFTYLCGTGRPPTTVYGMPIDSTGHFSHTAFGLEDGRPLHLGHDRVHLAELDRVRRLEGLEQLQAQAVTRRLGLRRIAP